MNTLEKQLEIAEGLVNDQREKLDNLHQVMVVERSKAVNQFLKPILREDDEIQSSSDYYRINRKHPDVTYLKEIFTFYARCKYGEDTHTLELNYYTGGSTGSEFELTRLEDLGKLAKLVRTEGPALVKKLDKIQLDHKISQDEYDKLNYLASNHRELRTAFQNKSEQDFRDKIVNSNEIRFSKMVKIFRTANRCVHTTGLKVLKVTPTGKTTTVSFDCGSVETEVTMKMDQLFTEIYRLRKHTEFVTA